MNPIDLINISFTFHKQDVDNPRFENGLCYNLRYLIAQNLELSGFGQVLFQDNDKFSNEFVVWVTDELYEPENDLFIRIDYPIQNHRGDFTFLITHCVANIIRTAHDLGCVCLFRISAT